MELTTSYEKRLHDSGERISEAEERLLAEESDLKKMVESLTAKREELLAKIKVVEEQSDLLANSKKIVLEEQRRFVEWERTLGEREKVLTRREGAGERRVAHAPERPQAPEPVFEEAKPEEILEEDNAAKMEANVEEDAPPMRSIPAPIEEPEEKQEEAPVEEEELKPELKEEPPAEEEKKEFECPNCGTIIDSNSERCWACDAKLKDGQMIEAPKKKETRHPEPRPKAEPVAEEKHIEEDQGRKDEHKGITLVTCEAPIMSNNSEAADAAGHEHEEDKKSEVKRSVSIRKIIKRK
jgi:hypothetical protein